eukprot:m.30660 g.30660  ORF g.30660 m.30660 type:complete len:68 (-) comp9309_c0_seq3:78-281(-)
MPCRGGEWIEHTLPASCVAQPQNEPGVRDTNVQVFTGTRHEYKLVGAQVYVMSRSSKQKNLQLNLKK